jgi:hypothetical protein
MVTGQTTPLILFVISPFVKIGQASCLTNAVTTNSGLSMVRKNCHPELVSGSPAF